jgi:hypothetical protein
MSQNTNRLRPGLLAATLALATGLSASSAALAAEQTINGFSSWEGEGNVYQTAPDTGTFVGAINGPLFVQTEKGPVAAGNMVCPALLEIDLKNATQVGQGKCTISHDDGAMVFAEWSCKGVHLVGCDGEFILTGGTGRMNGITGRGAVTVRTITQIAETKVMAGGMKAETARGILVLDNLTYSLPEQ